MYLSNLISVVSKLFKPLVVVLYFLVAFRVISRMPLGPMNEVLSVLILLMVTLLGAAEISSHLLRGRFNYLLLVLSPLLIYPFINAAVAQQVFGQPFRFGLLAQRYHYFLLGGFAVIYVLRKNILTTAQLEQHFLRSMYLILFIMYFFYIFINPAIFSGTEFVKLTGYKGWIYEFPNGVTAGLLIYSLIKFTLHKSIKNLPGLLLTLFFFVVYGKDRSQITFIVLVALMFMLFHLPLSRFLMQIISSLLLIALLFTVLMLITPDFVNHYTELFSNALTLFTGEQTEEYSTNIRHFESEVALKGFSENPWLGNGFLSSQWNDGYLQFYRYFYPADVGVLGNLYVYGIIGTTFYYIPFIAVFLWMRKMRKTNDAFLLTAFYTLIFIFLDMQSAANNIKFIGIQAFFIGVVYYFRYHPPDSANKVPAKLKSS